MGKTTHFPYPFFIHYQCEARGIATIAINLLSDEWFLYIHDTNFIQMPMSICMNNTPHIQMCMLVHVIGIT